MTDEARLKSIGEDGKPIRALAFAGGGYDTAMQLGVTHALLVSRAKAPDVVIGSSAGAINAVALAEVLQAGDPRRQVARFREIYEAYLDAPGVIRHAYRPDTFQVDTQRPLESVELPIHHKLEREAREKAVASRAGLINLLNTLLRLNLGFGTLTRAIRRGLGLRETGQMQNRVARFVVTAGEVFRSWMLLGQNLQHVAVLVGPILKAAFHRRLRSERGATAGELIFRSAVWGGLWDGASYFVFLVLLLATWLLGAVIVLAILWAVGWPLVWLGEAVMVKGFGTAPLSRLAGLVLPLAAGVPVLGFLFVRLAQPVRGRPFLATLWSFLMFGLLVTCWTAVLLALLIAPLIAYQAIRFARGWEPTMLAAPGYWITAGWVIGLAAVGGIAVGLYLWARRGTLGTRFLAQFGLEKSILDPYPLYQLLVSLFDPDYYGRVDMARVVETSLRNARGTQDGQRSEKRLDGYARTDQKTPIHVALTVADVATGEFKILPGAWRVVDGLVASLAAVPLFPPVPADRESALGPAGKPKDGTPPGAVSLLVDSLNVANEPTRPLFSFLRHSGLVNPQATAVLLYSVAPLPFGRPALGPERPDDRGPKEYNSLVDVSLRAWELRRFRDATLERRLTELHTKAMPRAGTVFFDTGGKTLIRSWVFPIEPEAPLRANERVLQTESPAVTRRIIAETIADGCRAALEVMIQPSIAEAAQAADERKAARRRERDQPATGRKFVTCRAAIRERLGRPADLPGRALPGSEAKNRGPGLTEVCEHCALLRHHRGPDGEPKFPRVLRLPSAGVNDRKPPAWPRADQEEDRWREPDRWSLAKPQTETYANIEKHWSGRWPTARGEVAANDRPTVSLLFSGGVFRGVFQVGALNALSEVSLIPDVVAGASVGSITAAMACRAFLTGLGADQETGRRLRAGYVLPLAAVYLAIDRLVLTDRFADFIRGVTVRAAEAGFSLRDVDRAFRRYDAARSGVFSRELRRVTAGIERLTYISPFELRDLLEALRRQEFGKATRLVRKNSQEWLERVGVGNEVLGAEPLTRLIIEYVLKGLPGQEGVPPEAVPFSAFHRQGLFFLATTTNLTQGCLETVGERQLADPNRDLTLLGTLLATSAFPGVFRPRWLWEFSPTTSKHHQFIDGGVIDNLPLDAVAQFLRRAARAKLIPTRPAAPHLLFAASLETGIDQLREAEVDALRHYWPGLLRHAQRLRYNQKLEIFARSQRNLRAIYDARKASAQGYDKNEWEPLDLEVVAVIPRWLCSTFGFHPMLGFRRERQAQSIAHGCAATLLRLGALRATPEGAEWSRAWGMDGGRLPSVEQAGAPDPFVPLRRPTQDGDCWFRPGCLCPFSAQGQDEVGAAVCGRTRQELTGIYRACGQPETHRVHGR